MQNTLSHEYILPASNNDQKVSLRLFDDSQSLARGAARFMLAGIKAHLGKNRYRIALSGGRTPRLMYAALALMPESAPLFNDRAEFFFSDERAVGPDHKDSNYGSARAELFEPLAISERIIHRMKGTATDLQAEAERYGELIRKSSEAKSIPSLELTLLGMGPDGHTASLFPDHDFSSDGDALVVAPWVKSKNSYRLSFSLSLINASSQVLFLVTGSDKAEVLADILLSDSISDRQSATDLPAEKVRAKSTLWMVDKSAASKLNLQDFPLVES